jgi:hypothetical protein
MVWSKVVTPVKTGVQYFCNTLKFLDSGVHRNDVFWAFSTFDQIINSKCGTIIGRRYGIIWQWATIAVYRRMIRRTKPLRGGCC